MSNSELTLLCMFVEAAVKVPKSMRKVERALSLRRRSRMFRSAVAVVKANAMNLNMTVARELSHRSNAAGKMVGGVLEWVLAN